MNGGLEPRFRHSTGEPRAAEFPEKLQCLFEPARYKVLYGGRGGAKSWGVARALLLLGAQKPLRILCARELQNSISDSVHRLLSDQIFALGLESFYDIKQTYIKGKNGTEFSFEGIRHNVNKIKSYEGIDICWVEEAQTVSRTSWTVLIPTIRKESAEIWVTFNPLLETDETYQRFIVHPPSAEIKSFIVKLNYRDNPWFPAVLEQERLELKARNMDEYLNVWEGECRQNLEGAVYAHELREAQLEGRIRSVRYDRNAAVDTFWDLGRRDATAIWFAQKCGFEYHILEYYENRQTDLSHYMRFLQNKPYVYGYHYLPFDAKAKTLGTKHSVEEQLRGNDFKVRIVPKLQIDQGINAARTIFPNCWFDEEKCADGLQCLRHYRYEMVEQLGERHEWSREPVHDWTSHGADAFRYLALALKEHRPRRKLRVEEIVHTVTAPFTEGLGWLGR